MKWTTGTKVFVGIAVVVVLLLLWFWGSYNGLVNADEKVNEQWSNVESQYQRRVDLIPNLVNTVKGFAHQELEVFTEVTRLRSQWAAAATREQKIATATEIEGALSRLLVVAESYPQLKSNENFLALQAELAGTENRIAVERMRYNEYARALNVKIRRFPTNVVASWFGFENASYFEADQGAEHAPTVSFQ